MQADGSFVEVSLDKNMVETIYDRMDEARVKLEKASSKFIDYYAGIGSSDRHLFKLKTANENKFHKYKRLALVVKRKKRFYVKALNREIALFQDVLSPDAPARNKKFWKKTIAVACLRGNGNKRSEMYSKTITDQEQIKVINESCNASQLDILERKWLELGYTDAEYVRLLKDELKSLNENNNTRPRYTYISYVIYNYVKATPTGQYL